MNDKIIDTAKEAAIDKLTAYLLGIDYLTHNPPGATRDAVAKETLGAMNDFYQSMRALLKLAEANPAKVYDETN